MIWLFMDEFILFIFIVVFIWLSFWDFWYVSYFSFSLLLKCFSLFWHMISDSFPLCSLLLSGSKGNYCFLTLLTISPASFKYFTSHLLQFFSIGNQAKFLTLILKSGISGLSLLPSIHCLTLSANFDTV